MSQRALYSFLRYTAAYSVKSLIISRATHCASGGLVSCQFPKTMKPDTPRRLSLKSIFTPELGELEQMFRRHGYELRIAGGAVRDLLSDKVPSDLDFATTATPDQMKQMFETENIRMINKRGEQHGTVTCRINDKVAFSCHLFVFIGDDDIMSLLMPKFAQLLLPRSAIKLKLSVETQYSEWSQFEINYFFGNPTYGHKITALPHETTLKAPYGECIYR